MVRTIIATLLAVIFASLAIADGALKCYVCDSVTNAQCKDLSINKMEPSECDAYSMQKWHNDLASNRLMNNLASLFEVDTPKHHQQPMVPTYACAKMNFKVGQEDVMVRSCQLAKTEYLDPCKVMQGKMNSMNGYSLESCDLCDSEACNSSSMITPKMFLFALPLLGFLVLQMFNRV